MRLEKMLTSLSEVPLVISLLSGAPWFVLVLATMYVLRPVLIKLIECSSQVWIEHLRHTPPGGAPAIPASKTKKLRKRRDG
jgi:hypothetical protein